MTDQLIWCTMYDVKKIGCLSYLCASSSLGSPLQSTVHRSHNLAYKIHCRDRPRAKTRPDYPSIHVFNSPATRFKILVLLLIFFRVVFIRLECIWSTQSSSLQYQSQRPPWLYTLVALYETHFHKVHLCRSVRPCL